jgi:hypothetical protein
MDADFQYEPLSIPYSRPSRYTPDFILPNGIIIEVKGFFKSADRSKHLLIQEQWPQLDIRFVFGRSSNKIGKKSKTTYAGWCRQKRFQCADLLVPVEWIQEPPNVESLAALAEIEGGTFDP